MSRGPDSDRDVATGPGHVHPTREDPVLGSLSEVVGGPVGEHAGVGRSWWTPVRVLLVLAALTAALGMASKTACAATDFGDGPGRFTHLCYSDVPVAYAREGLDTMAWPWSGDPGTRERYAVTEQPALVGLWAWGAAGATRLVVGADPDPDHARLVFTAVNAVALAGLALLATAALAGVRRRRPWDAAGFAAAPVLALAGLVSWDLLAVAAVAGALWAWARGRLVLTGLLLGVGVAAGVWPVLVLLALALLLVRRGEAARVLPVAVTALATWAVVNAPAFVTGRAQWERSWEVAVSRPPDAGSLWTVLGDAGVLGPTGVTAVAWALLAVWLVGVAALALTSRHEPRLAQVALLLVAGVLLLGVAYRPQQALWLLPLAALASPRWRDLLVWQAGEVLYFAMVWWYYAGVLEPGGGDGPGFYWLAILLRLGCTLWLVVVVVRDVRRPAGDPVREAGPATSTRSNQVVV